MRPRTSITTIPNALLFIANEPMIQNIKIVGIKTLVGILRMCLNDLIAKNLKKIMKILATKKVIKVP